MKTQLLTAAITTTLIATAQTSQAGDLSLAMSALKSAGRTLTRRVQTQPVAAKAAPTMEAVSPKLVLGAYLNDMNGSLVVTGTLPGSPASEIFQPGDIIRRVAINTRVSRNVVSINQFNYAKKMVGADRPAALEIVRPGTGIDYVWFTFPADGSPATFNAESTQANARSMFNNLNDAYVSR